MSTPNTIYLKGDEPVQEALAGGTITPGMLIERTSTGTFLAHASAEGNAYALFALENDVVGKNIDTDYASGDSTYAVRAERGDQIYALADATVAITAGDELVSNGNGYLKKVTSAAVAVGNLRRVVALALEGKASGTGRLKVEIV